MDALELLLGRESALKLGSPGPDEAALDAMLRSAVRAPDHGRVRPWRFVIVPEHRRQDFGEVLAQSMQRREPEASADMLRRERDKAMRAPLIVIVAAHVDRAGKILEAEQLSAVAAAAQNIMLAAHAQGYGAMWKTGAPAYDPATRQALGLSPDDFIIGFLYVGTRLDTGAAPPRPNVSDFVTVWQG
jgi:nitroreductase